MAGWGRGVVCAVVFAAAASGSAAAQSQRARVLTQDRATADSAGGKGLAAALGPHLSDSGIVLYPGAPVVRGRHAVDQLLAAQRGLDSLSLTWQPTAVDLAPDSSLAATWGVAAVTRRGTDRPLLGRYIAVWRREEVRWVLVVFLVPELGLETAANPGLPAELPAIGPGNPDPFLKADRDFARLAADSGAGVAFTRWAAPNAEMWSGNGLLVTGPAAIGRLVSGPNSWRWEPVSVGRSSDGMMGWTVGQAVISTPDGHAGPSKYITVWRKQRNGSVRFIHDGGNGR